jgi:hypothetical protein
MSDHGSATTEASTNPARENHENPNTFTVFVAYNGLEKSITANTNETVQALLNRAIQEFHISSQPHVLSLFTQAGDELADTAKVGDAGVRPGDHLLLRPGKVKGGGIDRRCRS